MKKRIFWIFIWPFLLGATISGTAQGEKSGLFSISAGSSVMARQDAIYSPFVHSDQSLLSFGVKYQSDKRLFQYLEGNFSVNASKIGGPSEIEMGHHKHAVYPHEFLFINTSYGIGKPLKETSNHKEWIGLAVKIDLQATFYNFVLSNMFGYFIDQSANIWYRRAYHFGDKHRLSAHIELPVFSWLARPHYLAEDDEFIENISSHNSLKIILSFIEDGKPTTWNKLQRVNLNFEYLYPISSRLLIGADYRFAFIHSSDPKTLLSYQHNFNFTISFKI